MLRETLGVSALRLQVAWLRVNAMSEVCLYSHCISFMLPYKSTIGSTRSHWHFAQLVGEGAQCTCNKDDSSQSWLASQSNNPALNMAENLTKHGCHRVYGFGLQAAVQRYGECRTIGYYIVEYNR